MIGCFGSGWKTKISLGMIGVHWSSNLLEELSEGDAKSLAILRKLSKKDKEAVLIIAIKGLRSSRIWELYEAICGRDMDRFIYHIMLELPCQKCGRIHIVPEIYWENRGLSTALLDHHFFARQYGDPNSFWALASPPAGKNYEYPIVIISLGFEIY